MKLYLSAGVKPESIKTETVICFLICEIKNRLSLQHLDIQ